MNELLRLLAALVLIVVQGCVTSNFMPVGKQTYPPRPDDYVIDVFVPTEAPVVVQQSIGNAKSSADLPTGYTVIGRIDTNGAPAAAWSSVIDDAKKKARQLGGDGIVINQWGEPLVGMSYGQAYHAKAIGMQVVRYSDR